MKHASTAMKALALSFALSLANQWSLGARQCRKGYGSGR